MEGSSTSRDASVGRSFTSTRGRTTLAEANSEQLDISVGTSLAGRLPSEAFVDVRAAWVSGERADGTVSFNS